jgi:hypothetical protein
MKNIKITTDGIFVPFVDNQIQISEHTLSKVYGLTPKIYYAWGQIKSAILRGVYTHISAKTAHLFQKFDQHIADTSHHPATFWNEFEKECLSVFQLVILSAHNLEDNEKIIALRFLTDHYFYYEN